MFSFPLHLWTLRNETVKEQEIMNGLLQEFKKQGHKARWNRLNEERKPIETPLKTDK